MRDDIFLRKRRKEQGNVEHTSAPGAHTRVLVRAVELGGNLHRLAHTRRDSTYAGAS